MGAATDSQCSTSAMDVQASDSDFEDNAPHEDNAPNEDESTKFVEDPTRPTTNNANSHLEDNVATTNNANSHLEDNVAHKKLVPVFAHVLTPMVDFNALRGAEYEQRRATVTSALAAAAARESQRRGLENPASAAYGRGVHEEGQYILEVYESRRRTVQFAVEAAAAREARINAMLVDGGSYHNDDGNSS